MRVRIQYTVAVSDAQRRRMRQYYGQDGLASRAEIELWYRINGYTLEDDLLDLPGPEGHGPVTGAKTC